MMAKKSQKYCVVWKGVQPGIYKSWAECQQQIKNFNGAYFMAFPNEEQAKLAYHGNMWDYIGKKGEKKPLKKTHAGINEANLDSWSVDAACSGNPGIMEYQCVDTGSGVQIFHAGLFGLVLNLLSMLIGSGLEPDIVPSSRLKRTMASARMAS